MVSSLQSSWPEPVVRVQSLSDSGIHAIPERYIRPLFQRPTILHPIASQTSNLPVIDMHDLDLPTRDATLARISEACQEWGFFQVVNHGVSHHLMNSARRVWREFFHLPPEVKQEYANSPTTYEGYGSRLGVEKGAKLDWRDYFFLIYLPASARDENKWPSQASGCREDSSTSSSAGKSGASSAHRRMFELLREVIAEYNGEVAKLCGKLMKILSINLGLKQDSLEKALGGEEVGATLRVSFYPKCPQPDLTLGLSPHSDPGAMTILLPDEHVSGLQIHRGDSWINVEPKPNAFIVNIGDQLQVLSNAKYKSVEHRVIVNSNEERVSLAFFYNPKEDVLIEPLKELITEDQPAQYLGMTYNEYRTCIRMRGPTGKARLESLKSPR